MKNKKILITGGAGFIGFQLAKRLQQEGNELTLIDNFSRYNKDDELELLLQEHNVRFINADLTSNSFHNILDKYYDEVYHLAAINGTKYFYEKPYEVLRVNILTLMNMLEWINEKNTGKFIFTSSSEAYAGTILEFGTYKNLIPTKENIPLCVNDVFNERFSYGGSKITGELLTINYFKKVHVPFSIVRYHNIYGPRMGFEHVIPEFCKRIYVGNDPFELFGGEETRAFCYVSDGVDGTIMTMRENKTNGHIINIGNDAEEIKIRDLAKLMLKITNSHAEIKINKAPLGSVERRCPDISRIRKFTSYSPNVDLLQGLKLTIDWYFNKLN